MPQKPPFTPEAKVSHAVDEAWTSGQCNLKKLSYTFRTEDRFCFHLCLDHVLKVLEGRTDFFRCLKRWDDSHRRFRCGEFGTDQSCLFHPISCWVLRIRFHSGVISWENNYIMYMQILFVVH